MFRQSKPTDCNCQLWARQPINQQTPTTAENLPSSSGQQPRKRSLRNINRSKGKLTSKVNAKVSCNVMHNHKTKSRQGRDSKISLQKRNSTLETSRGFTSQAHTVQQGQHAADDKENNPITANHQSSKADLKHRVCHHRSKTAVQQPTPADPACMFRSALLLKRQTHRSTHLHPAQLASAPTAAACKVPLELTTQQSWLSSDHHQLKQSVCPSTVLLPAPAQGKQLGQFLQLEQQSEQESIYTGEEGEAEYSRVILSCRKLMEEQNGELLSWAQTRLFSEEVTPSLLKHSETFERITIGRAGVR